MRAILVGLLLSASPVFAKTPAPKAIAWIQWSDDLFEKAKAEHRLVLLDLEAVWCHWCHVMDEKSYSDPKVIDLIAKHYIAVKVDQDSRPDLASRYEDYGWPATIVFKEDGSELAKRSGYIEPQSFAGMLQAFVDHPTPGPSVHAETALEFAASPGLDEALRKRLETAHDNLYDSKNIGWAGTLKFLEWRSVEYAMARAYNGNKDEEARVKATLQKEATLIDPVWGGVYQYSDSEVWTNPHFEKIMQFQAENTRIFSLAFALWHAPEHLQAAKDIYKFSRDFLTSPEGAFYVSMDADVVKGEHSAEYFKKNDAGRRKAGIPRIDDSVYARENGWMIRALVALYEASRDDTYLDAAKRACAWILAHRSLDGVGFSHGENDRTGPYLGDNLAMAQALLSLYEATGDRAFLERAEKTAQFIAKTFAPGKGGVGFVAARPSKALPSPKPTRDENVELARFANLLYRDTGVEAYKAIADQSMRFAVTKGVAEKLPTGGVLLAAIEQGREPTHITVVGAKSDSAAKALYQAAIGYPATYKRIEWWDRAEGPLRRMDVIYPETKVASAFACTNQRCSLPITNPDALLPKVEALLRSTPE